MSRLPIGIDNYGIQPLGLSPVEVLIWAETHRAEGVQFSGLSSRERAGLDGSGLADLAQTASDLGLYLEWGGGQHIPFDMSTWEPKKIFDSNRQAAEEASRLGTRIVRSCSGGLMRWDPANPQTETLLVETARSLRNQRGMLKDNGVILALETHFEFTTSEIVRLFDMCEAEPGEYLGICLDTMNLLTMLEDPLAATERVLPWVVSTHIKDGALVFDSEGLVSFPAEIGSGVVDITAIVNRLESLPFPVNLSIEDHGGSFPLPVFEARFLAEFPDLTLEEFVDLTRLASLAIRKIEEGSLSMTDRSRWPEICAQRLRRDIRNLKKILNGS